MIQLILIYISLVKAKNSNTNCDSAYCSSCEPSNICSSCIAGYILKDNDCIWREDLHCATVSNMKCVKCSDGYSLSSNNTCIQCPELNGCQKLSGDSCDSGCSYCQTRTYYNTTTKRCQNDDINCISYLTEGTCYFCNGLYILDSDKQCIKGAIDNCVLYNDENNCWLCTDNLIGNNGECVQYSIDNCASVNTDDISDCNICNDGYQLSDDLSTCFECKVENCKKCVSKESDQCDVCNDYFYNDNNQCLNVTNIDNCLTYSEINDECTNCNSGYSLISGECIECNVTNCEKCSTSIETCETCAIGFVLVDGVCEKCLDVNCESCNSYNKKCEVCSDGYFMNKNFTCSKCASWCEYSPDNIYSKCTHTAYNCYADVLSNNGCILYDSDGQTCLKCYNFFTLDNGKCYSYYEFSEYNGDDYSCFKFRPDDKKTDVYHDVEIYDPVNGVCENPYLSEESSNEVVISEESSTEVVISEESSTEVVISEESSNEVVISEESSTDSSFDEETSSEKVNSEDINDITSSSKDSQDISENSIDYNEEDKGALVMVIGLLILLSISL